MMESVWDLIESGEFAAACRLADEQSASSTSLLPKRNKVIALLNLGKLEQAAELSRAIIATNGGSTDSDFHRLGVALWLQGEFDGAIAAWQAGSDTDYTDAARGVKNCLLRLYA